MDFSGVLLTGKPAMDAAGFKGRPKSTLSSKEWKPDEVPASCTWLPPGTDCFCFCVA